MASNVAMALIVVAGCEQSMQPETTTSRTAPAPSPVKTIAATGPSDIPQREQEAPVRGFADLQAELAALQSDQGALQIERDRLTGQLESHQAEGQKRLAELKRQWNALGDTGGAVAGDAAARERFAERARVEMESALMMDQEYRAQLEETDGKLRDLQQKMNSLRQEQTPR
jgi:chromosome segregation ATPase